MNLWWIGCFLLSVLMAPPHSLALDVNEKAPLFEAGSTHGTIRLSDYLGKKTVLLAFYLKDFTAG
jgi:peroxiredoxin